MIRVAVFCRVSLTGMEIHMLRNGFEPWHLIILLAVVLLMFGGAKLPELARGMGRSIRIFRSEMNEAEKEKTGEPSKIEGTTQARDADSVQAMPETLAK